MYTSHFGLREPPFAITPDPRYLYMSERHREALAHLVYGAGEGGGFVQLTGEVGTGKTTLCRCLLEQLPPKVDVALILNPRLTSLELLAAVCDELRIPYPPETSSPKVLVDALYGYLLDAHARGRRTVLIVDEAQDLSAEVLEQIRLLTNLETTREKLLQIILIGQPELTRILAREDLRQLAQRITARYHLTPFSDADTRAYVRHRLQVAGRTRGIFTESAMRRVHAASRGIPRLVNVICDRALLGAYAQEKAHVDARMVARAAAEVRGRAPRRWDAGRWRWAMAGSVLVLAAGIAILTPKPFAHRDATVAPPGGSARVTAASAPAPRDGVAAPVAPVAAAIGASRMPTLAAILADAGVRTDEVSAFAVLYGRWGVEKAETRAERGCEAARAEGLRCLLRTGSWNRLRRYNLPAILELTGPAGSRHFVAAVALAEETVTLAVGGRELRVPLREVESLWDGDFTLLWRPPVGTAPLVPGMRARDVDWLRRRLAAIDGGPATAASRELYDRELKARVVSFQKSRSLDPDGIVGEDTLAHLTATSRESGVPVLSPPGP
jgi:general secretion pathway protein A